MSPESPGNLITLDLEWRNSRLECEVDRYDNGKSFLYVSWNAIECPKHYVPVGGGAAYVWVPEGYTNRRYRARVTDIDEGFEWIDKAQTCGAMLILVLPLSYVFLSSDENAATQYPVDFKSTKDGRMGCYWWLEQGRFSVQWRMEYREGADLQAECRKARRKRSPVVSPVHLDRPPEEMNVPSHQPRLLNTPPEWQVGTLHIGDKFVIKEAQMTSGDFITANVGATVINRSTVTNALNRVREEHDEGTAELLKKVADIVEKSGDPKAIKLFNAFSDQLQQKQPDKTVLESLWESLTGALPAIGSIAGAAAGIAKLFG